MGEVPHALLGNGSGKVKHFLETVHIAFLYKRKHKFKIDNKITLVDMKTLNAC